MRMRAGIDLAELHDANLRVDLRGVQPFVAKKLLDETDVGAVLQHVGGTRVPQAVARSRARNPRRIHDAPNPVADVAGAEAFAVTAEEQSAVGPGGRQKGAGPPQIDPEPIERMFPQGDGMDAVGNTLLEEFRGVFEDLLPVGAYPICPHPPVSS